MQPATVIIQGKSHTSEKEEEREGKRGEERRGER
jgi:hypothetical protein